MCTALVVITPMFISLNRVGAAAVISLLAGCTIPVESQAPTTTTYITITAAPSSETPTTTASNLEEIVATAEAETGVQLGIALGDEVAGSTRGGPAWSTAKVPVAIAAVRTNPELSSVMWPAITASDNAAAQQLWDELGGGEPAAQATNAVLREGGDTITMTQPLVIREGFTAFGQTHWELIDQARFATGLSHMPGAEEVVSAMGNIAPDQRYGLGSIEGAIFKGGWGPELDGRYLVRQFGTIPTADGVTGVAIMAIGPDFGSAQQALTVLVTKLQEQMR